MISSYKILAQLYVPARLQKERWLAIVSCLAAPFEVLSAAAALYRSGISRRTRVNGQVCHLQAFLNGVLFCSSVEIVDGDLNPMFLRHQTDPFASRPIGHQGGDSFWIGHQGDEMGNDFIVRVPSTWISTKDGSAQLFTGMQKARVNALVKKYKLMQKTFRIETK